MDLAEVAAHIEIQQVLYRYCRGVDRGDAAMIASVYHPGAIDRHGAWSGPGKSFAEYLVPNMDKAGRVGQHHITNALIEVRGDEARVESYYIALHPETREGGTGHVLVCGRYLDRFARRDGAWLIDDREVMVDVSRPLTDVADWAGAANFPAGQRREADRSAELFARRAPADLADA